MTKTINHCKKKTLGGTFPACFAYCVLTPGAAVGRFTRVHEQKADSIRRFVPCGVLFYGFRHSARSGRSWACCRSCSGVPV